MTNKAESVHGHDVMNMMIESDQVYTKESLREAMAAKFGAATLYHTCSAEDMTADDLITFLDDRGKFTDEDSGAGFKTDSDKVCNH